MPTGKIDNFDLFAQQLLKKQFVSGLNVGDLVMLTNCYYSTAEMKAVAAKNGFYNYKPVGIVYSKSGNTINVLMNVNAHLNIDHQWSDVEAMSEFEGKLIPQEMASRIVTELEAENIVRMHTAQKVRDMQPRPAMVRSSSIAATQALWEEKASNAYQQELCRFRKAIGAWNLEDYKLARNERLLFSKS